MDQPVKISVCIPAYKRIDYLKRLLDSICEQTYPHFEVVLSDDSPDDAVERLFRQYHDKLACKYFRNTPSLGTPANWNHAIKHSSGEWIKIMHDDDWFSNPHALQLFADTASRVTTGLIFCSYYDVFLPGNKQKRRIPGAIRFRLLRKEPGTILSKNIIGPPSVVMHRNDGKFEYDVRMKWLVDIDMYVRRLASEDIIYIPDALVKVGVGKEQVTASVHGYPHIEIPEHFSFLNKTGVSKLRFILVYDYWWRLFRNFSITNTNKVREYGYEGDIHSILSSMISWQNKIPASVLRVGIFSKIFMFMHYCTHQQKLRS